MAMFKLRRYRLTQPEIKAIWDEAFVQGKSAGNLEESMPKLYRGLDMECEHAWLTSKARYIYPDLFEENKNG